jgi:hypothetical protein
MPQRQQFPGAHEVEFIDLGNDLQLEGRGEAKAVKGSLLGTAEFSGLNTAR